MSRYMMRNNPSKSILDGVSEATVQRHLQAQAAYEMHQGVFQRVLDNYDELKCLYRVGLQSVDLRQLWEAIDKNDDGTDIARST